MANAHGESPLLERFPLAVAHDASCVSCHDTGDYTVALDPTCETCHAEALARAEVREGGLHNPGRSCADCHEPVVWERDNEHDGPLLEELPLVWSHDLPCAECHSPPGEYTGLDANTCAPCHEPDRAAHKVAMGVDAHYDAWDCNLCHVSATWVWSGGDFDHTLGFVSECGSCHEPERPVDHWKGDCVDCHVPDTPDKWDDIDIDHSFFALTDAHDATTVACKDCHTSGTFKGLDSECQSCHESDRTTY